MKYVKMCEEYKDGWIDYPKIGRITDAQVADMVMKHTTIFDRIFRPRKIAIAALLAQTMLMGVIDTPKERWRF